MRYHFQQIAASTLKARNESALLDELNQFRGGGEDARDPPVPRQRVPPQANSVSGLNLQFDRCQISPLWSSGQSCWLQNGDVLCFL
jgi:hypothetical protein